VRLPVAPIKRSVEARIRLSLDPTRCSNQPAPAEAITGTVVDDEYEVREAVLNSQRSEAEVRVAGSAAEALEILKEWRPTYGLRYRRPARMAIH